MVFQYINIRQVPWEVLKTVASGRGLGFQHLPRDLTNVNAWQTMFDPYIVWRSSLGTGIQGNDSLLHCTLHFWTQPRCIVPMK